MNEYALKKLALLERIAEGLESLNEKGLHVMNFHLPEGTALQAVGNVVQAGPATADVKKDATEAKHDGDKTEVIDPKLVEQAKKDAAAAKAAKEKAELDKANADAQLAAKADKKDAAAEGKKDKPVTLDEARAAVKKFAAKEGNDAAMELLKTHGASSVTGLMEQGDETVRKLIAAVVEATKE